MPAVTTVSRLLLFCLLVSVFVIRDYRIAGQDTTASKVALGAKLFFDKRLSLDHTVSCATCHDPATAFTSKDTVAIGVQNRIGTRNVPTLLNARFGNSYFWDGRSPSLEEQAKQPLLSPLEMGMISEAALVKRVSAIADYRLQFRRVFGDEGITLNTVVKAIASYERTLVSRDAPFDRFIAGDVNAITPTQLNGWELFKGKAGCVQCHTFSPSTPFFTDFKFYNTGAARADQDLGRFLVTRAEKDIGAFKTPALRDVELTGPYMHNGFLPTLLDVVRFYNQGGRKNPNLDARMRTLDLSETEMNEIVEFLRTLTSDEVLRRVQTSAPQTRHAASAKPQLTSKPN